MVLCLALSDVFVRGRGERSLGKVDRVPSSFVGHAMAQVAGCASNGSSAGAMVTQTQLPKQYTAFPTPSPPSTHTHTHTEKVGFQRDQNDHPSLFLERKTNR